MEKMRTRRHKDEGQACIVRACKIGKVKGRILVDERIDDGDNAYYTGLRACVVDRDGNKELHIPDPYHSLAHELRREFSTTLLNLGTTEMNSWIEIQLLRSLHAVRVGEGARLYFVPCDAVDTWKRQSAAIVAGSGFSLHGMKAMRDGDAVEMVIEAVQAEARALFEDLESGLQVEEGETVGKRKLNTMKKKLEENLKKVRYYEDFLGTGLDGIRQRAAEVSAAVNVAALAASMASSA